MFPTDPALLADLPGIGRSTAAAIAAFSAGARAAILDGNVKRVFARVFGIRAGSAPFPGALLPHPESLFDQALLEIALLQPEAFGGELGLMVAHGLG